MGRWSNVVQVSTGHSLEREEVHRIFANLGEIRSIYPSGNSCNKNDIRTFIEFSQDVGASNALAFHTLMPHIHVRALDDDPTLLEEYRMAMAAARKETGFSDQNHISNPRDPLVNHSAVETRARPVDVLRETSDEPNGDEQVVTTELDAPVPFSIDLNVFESLKQRSTPLLTNTSSTYTSLFPEKGRTPPIVASSMDAQLTVSFHGQTFTYDMKSVQSDPRPIVELLTLSSSEPGTWMTAAAYYRRNGYPESSIGILMAMIKSMRRLHVSEETLHPVFLMLSGCETDMAKTAKAQAVVNRAIVTQHYENSKKWLQKVYGVDTPQQKPNANLDNGLNVPFYAKTVLTSTVEKSCKDILVSNQATDPLPKFAPLRGRVDIENLPSSHGDSSLIAVQRAKRKLEEDCIYEREQRRRLERELKEVARERDASRRSEDRMRLLIREESEAREKAEAVAERARSLRKESDNRATPLLEDLARMLRRAAA